LGWHPVAAVQYKFTHKQYIEQHNRKKQHIEQHNSLEKLGRVRTVPRLCEVYPGIGLTTEEKAQKNLSQGSCRMPVGTMETEYTEQSIRNNKNT
jgi:hypothetical protein